MIIYSDGYITQRSFKSNLDSVNPFNAMNFLNYILHSKACVVLYQENIKDKSCKSRRMTSGRPLGSVQLTAAAALSRDSSVADLASQRLRRFWQVMLSGCTSSSSREICKASITVWTINARQNMVLLLTVKIKIKLCNRVPTPASNSRLALNF